MRKRESFFFTKSTAGRGCRRVGGRGMGIGGGREREREREFLLPIVPVEKARLMNTSDGAGERL